MTKLKPCPICGIGKLRMVHYALPLKYNPDVWEETEDCLFEPVVTFKHIECSNCGASALNYTISVDYAIEDWNHEDKNGNRDCVMQYIIDEDMEVEE